MTDSAPTLLPLIALVGNPNTGKTTLFNTLAGMNQRVGNYPGVTVETKSGKMTLPSGPAEVLDLPGAYSLAPRSPDEMVAVELVLGLKAGDRRPDLIVSIVDASNLERNLYLTTQVLELGIPVVLAVNMVDVAESQGIRLDYAALAKGLNVPIVPIQANKGKGIGELKSIIADALKRRDRPTAPTFPEAFEREVSAMASRFTPPKPEFLVRRLLLDVGGQIEKSLASQHNGEISEAVKAARQRLADSACPVPAVEARTRYAWIRQATAAGLQRPKTRPVTWTDRIDRVLTHWFLGTTIFLGLMFVVFQCLFTWSEPIKDLIGVGQEKLIEFASGKLSPGPLRSLVIDGVIKGVGGVVVFLPQILILFAFIAVLEDCGYMARAAFLMDRLMSRAGLNGKSFIPLLSSVGCAVPGIMAARVIENWRDRLATILVAPLMSCSARLPVYSLFIGVFLSPDDDAPLAARMMPGLTLFAMYLIGFIVAPVMAFLIKGTLLRGETPPFIMEMPLYKRPSIRQVLARSIEAGWMFVRRAGTLILATMVIVWALLYYPVTDGAGRNYDLELTPLRDKIGETRKSLEEVTEKIKEAEDGGARAPEVLVVEKKNLEEAIEADESKANALEAEWRGASYLGRIGRGIEPVVKPLGWDWRIGMAAVASFPAREVMAGTLGIIFAESYDPQDDAKESALGRTLREATWRGEPGRRLFTVPTAFSVMVFFALCCQCVSTLAVIRRETKSWRWPIFTFVYMTALAYLGALLTFQIGSLFS